MKSYIELVKSCRNSWGNVNPITRIHDNKLKTDKKKIRKESKKIVKNWKENI